MLKRRALCLLTVLLVLIAPAAQAFIDPPWITPAAPRAGETIFVNFRMGVCDARAERQGYPQITRDGQAIRLLVYGHHYQEGDERCIYPIGTGNEPIGRFPPGDYVVTVDFLYENYPFGYATMTLGVIPFTVTGAPTTQVTTLSPTGFFGLFLLLSGLATRAMRMRRTWRLMIVFSVAVAPSAHAFFDPPWITPATPHANEVVSVNIRLGICDAIAERPGYPQVSRDGSEIRIVEYGVHWEDDELCGFGIGTATDPIGTLSAGAYTLIVDFLYTDVQGYQTMHLGVIPFTVRSAALATPVPTLELSGLSAMSLIVLTLAAQMLRTRRAPLLLILLSTFVAPTAYAFVDPPWITPTMPRIGEIVSVNTRMGICDAVIFKPGYPQVTQVGHAVRILVYGNHYSEGDERCVYPIGTGTEPIGSFQQGDYTVTVDILYENYPFGYETVTLGVIPFTVTGAPATQVPTWSPTGFLGLFLLLLGFATWAMRTRRAWRLMFVFSAAVAPSAHAFFDPPWITPPAPHEGEIVSVNIRLGICDAFFFMPGYPQLTRDGNAIRIVEYGHHWEDDELCGYGIGTATDPIGAFEPGDYIVTFDFIYENYPFGYETMTLGVIPFTVTDAPAKEVPTSSPPALLAMMLLVSSLAARALRTRRVGHLAIFSCIFVAPSAHAFFDTPWISPAAPHAAEVVSVNIRDGICDAIFERQGYPQITRNGNYIRILEYGHHWEDEELCIYEVGTTVDTIGAFQPGVYTLTVDFIYENYPFGYTTITLGVVPFTVTDAASQTAIPILTEPWLIILLLLILGSAARAL